MIPGTVIARSLGQQAARNIHAEPWHGTVPMMHLPQSAWSVSYSKSVSFGFRMEENQPRPREVLAERLGYLPADADHVPRLFGAAHLLIVNVLGTIHSHLPSNKSTIEISWQILSGHFPRLIDSGEQKNIQSRRIQEQHSQLANSVFPLSCDYHLHVNRSVLHCNLSLPAVICDDRDVLTRGHGLTAVAGA